MLNVHITNQTGLECKEAVDALYERNGSQARARPSDLFINAYADDRLVGCVRYCVEFNTAVLRSMMIDENYRGRGIGMRLLDEVKRFLEESEIHNVYCLPYAHLEEFYSRIGFSKVEPSAAPDFLYQRLISYNGPTEVKMICMKRD